MDFSNKVPNVDTRSPISCVLRGRNIIDNLTKEDVELLAGDPNFCMKNTLSSLCKHFSGGEMSRGQWMIDQIRNDATLTHISMCIKEDLRQTLASLAFRIAYEKRVEFAEAAMMLKALQDAGMLFYYDYRMEGKAIRIEWIPGENNLIVNEIAKCKRHTAHKRKQNLSSATSTPDFKHGELPIYEDNVL